MGTAEKNEEEKTENVWECWTNDKRWDASEYKWNEGRRKS